MSFLEVEKVGQLRSGHLRARLDFVKIFDVTTDLNKAWETQTGSRFSDQ